MYIYISEVYILIGWSIDNSTFSNCTQGLFQRSLALFNERDPQVTSHVGHYCWCFLTLALNWSTIGGSICFVGAVMVFPPPMVSYIIPLMLCQPPGYTIIVPERSFRK